MVDDLTKKVKWVTKIGHELTFMPTKKFPKNITDVVISESSYHPWIYINHLKDQIDKLKRKLYLGNIQIELVYEDCGCVEVSSKPLTSWKSFVDWNNKVREAARDLDLAPTIDWCAGGSGHHHIDLPSKHTSQQLFKIVAARPYLAWMFIDPGDTINANSIAGWFIKNHTNTKSYFNCYYSSRSINLPAGRSVCMSYRENTIEWRAFDSAHDMKMQVEHTAFLQALVSYAKQSENKIKDFDPLFSSIKEARDLRKRYASSLDLCVRDFYRDLDMLGLPRKRFERYVDMNLKPRLERKNAI